ncbi:MAG TPA: 50S ribosomal protein L25 [Pyrinomonadaceae bacterium]|nr:50S ribosomal protein L25 [Pyrinomonadaceae bacterium]
MAEKKEFTIQATRREGRGKNDARRVRAAGRVPLTIYGGEGDSVSASASLAELAAILRTESGHNTIFTLDIDGEGGHDVMFLDRQIDPVRGRLVHADLRRLVRGQKIEVTVPLHLTGEPIGVTEGGGVLEQMVREIEIRVSPRDIPDAINLDVSNLGVHDVLHVSDIPADEKIEILSDADAVLATVGIIREEPVEAPVATDEEGAEPEVIGKGKKDDEEEA